MCLSCFGFFVFQGAPVPNPSVFKVLTPKISNFPDRSWNFGCLFWGSVFGAFLGLPLGGFLGAFWRPFGLLGGLFGPPWVPLGRPWGRLGPPWVPFWAPLGSLGSLFGILWAAFGVESGPICVYFAPKGLPRSIFEHFLHIFSLGKLREASKSLGKLTEA